MVVFITLEKPLVPQSMGNPYFSEVLIVYFVLLVAAKQQLVLLSGGIDYMVCSSL